MSKTKIVLSIVLLFGVALRAYPQQVELNTALMESTYEIVGQNKDNPKNISGGTVFFLGRASKTNPAESYYVLVTARHVLDDIADQATIILREKQPDGTFSKHPVTFNIRENGKDLYVHDDEADVAAMYFRMPIKKPFTLINMDFLANDDRLKQLELHPGDELSCLGFPLFVEGNPIGFPVLRSGKIASYPLTPTKDIKSILYDFHVFEGNSGGPVYFTYETRYFGGALRAGGMEGIVGLVSQQLRSKLPEHLGEPLELAVVVPASFIIDTINKLPENPTPYSSH